MSDLPSDPAAYHAEHSAALAGHETEVSAALVEAEAFLKLDHLTPEYKIESTKTFLSEGAAKLEQVIAERIAAAEALVKRAEAVARAVEVPSADDLLKLNYIKDELSSRWALADGDTILNDFEAALAGDDKLLIRTYANHAGNYVLNGTEGHIKELRKAQLERLLRQAQDKIDSEQQRRARAYLKLMVEENGLASLRSTGARIVESVRDAKIENGRVYDGYKYRIAQKFGVKPEYAT